MKDKLKVGVIGVGRLGSIHARIYSELEEVELVGVYDINVDKAIEVGRQLGVRTFPTMQALLSEVSAVSIVVPTTSHYEVAREAIERGRHCLIEKPFTGSLSLAKRLFRLAKKKGVILQVGHVERFNSAMQMLREMVPSAPIFVECHRLSPFPNRATDVSVVMDLMIHDIDICLWFIPHSIKRVEAVGAPVLTGKDDIANARITFKNGTICDITASRVSDETVRKIRMFFPGAYVSIDYIEQQVELFVLNKGNLEKRVLQPTRSEPLKEEIKAFVKAIRTGTNPPVSGMEGLLALKVAERINKAISKTRSRIIRKRFGYGKASVLALR